MRWDEGQKTKKQKKPSKLFQRYFFFFFNVTLHLLALGHAARGIVYIPTERHLSILAFVVSSF